MEIGPNDLHGEGLAASRLADNKDRQLVEDADGRHEEILHKPFVHRNTLLNHKVTTECALCIVDRLDEEVLVLKTCIPQAPVTKTIIIIKNLKKDHIELIKTQRKSCV